jgi:DNA-directed RNA polymerase subunit L
MNLRLQTCGGTPAVAVLKDALHEMVEICDLLDYKLDAALAEYEAKGKGGKGAKGKEAN